MEFNTDGLLLLVNEELKEEFKAKCLYFFGINILLDGFSLFL